MLAVSKAQLTVIGTIFIFSTIGYGQIWGSLLPYYTSYFRTDNPELSA